MAFKMKGSPMKRNFGIQFDITTKAGRDLLKQHEKIKTVRSTDVGRVAKNVNKLKNISKLFRGIIGPAAAMGILDAARKLNIKGGRTTDVYKERKRGYMDLGKSQLNKKQ